MECKCGDAGYMSTVRTGFNRYIVECKWQTQGHIR